MLVASRFRGFIMLYDLRAVAVTAQTQRACDAFDQAVASFLAHRQNMAAHLSVALAEDPDFVLAHCLSGFSYLLLGRSELLPHARGALEAAQTALNRRGGTRRECRVTEALAAWCDGEMTKAAAVLDEVLEFEPHDALIAKLVHLLRFMLGDVAGMLRSIERILPAWSLGVPEYGFMLGCHAFALEESGALTAAERVGRDAVATESLDVWACHAVTHVYEMRGEPSLGLAWALQHEPHWEEVNNFARHMFWHRALLHLARNEGDIALALYDAKVRDRPTDDYRDIANAASLLLRLERKNIRVGSRWTELADLAEQRKGDHTLAFAQLHYLLCLLGDRRFDAAYQFFAAMDIEARHGRGTQAQILASIGIDLAKRMLAKATGDGDAIGEAESELREGIAKLGGSRAQRQTFTYFLDAVSHRGFKPDLYRSRKAPASPSAQTIPCRLRQDNLGRRAAPIDSIIASGHQ